MWAYIEGCRVKWGGGSIWLHCEECWVTWLAVGLHCGVVWLHHGECGIHGEKCWVIWWGPLGYNNNNNIFIRT